MIKKEKIKKGYEISVKNLEETLKENKPNAYINRQKEELNATDYKKFKDFIWDPWVRFGACFAFISHPVKGYKTIKQDLEYKNKNPCSGECSWKYEK